MLYYGFKCDRYVFRTSIVECMRCDGNEIYTLNTIKQTTYASIYKPPVLFGVGGSVIMMKLTYSARTQPLEYTHHQARIILCCQILHDTHMHMVTMQFLITGVGGHYTARDAERSDTYKQWSHCLEQNILYIFLQIWNNVRLDSNFPDNVLSASIYPKLNTNYLELENKLQGCVYMSELACYVILIL